MRKDSLLAQAHDGTNGVDTFGEGLTLRMELAMLTYDAVMLPSPEIIIALTAVTFAILLVAIAGIRRRRRKAARLRMELDRMSARITALELAENRHLLMRVKSNPLVTEHIAETALAPPAIAASSNGHNLDAR
jgi:hypothetical protein